MITTVTTTTVAALGSATSLAIVAIAILLILLVNKEVILSSQKEWARRLGLALNIAIVPLLLMFGVTVLVRLAAIL